MGVRALVGLVRAGETVGKGILGSDGGHYGGRKRLLVAVVGS